MLGNRPSTEFSNAGRLLSKFRAFVNFTEELGSLSTCKRLKVGCAVIPQDMTEVMSIGYNGPPAGEANDGCRNCQGGCGCVHAEANAIIKIKNRARDLVMICTRSPCEHCAGLIINSRAIDGLVYIDDYRDPTGLDLIRRRGIAVCRAGDILGEGLFPALGTPEAGGPGKGGVEYPGPGDRALERESGVWEDGLDRQDRKDGPD